LLHSRLAFASSGVTDWHDENGLAGFINYFNLHPKTRRHSSQGSRTQDLTGGLSSILFHSFKVWQLAPACIVQQEVVAVSDIEPVAWHLWPHAFNSH
jgi:hypothetical protein